MKLLLKIAPLLLLPAFVTAQTRQQMDSLHLVIQHAANDTIRMGACSVLGSFYDDVNLDSSLYYGEKGISIAKKLNLKLNEAETLGFISFPLMKMGNYPRALKVLNQALEIAENPSNEKNTWHLQKRQTPHMYRLSVISLIHLALDGLYAYTGNYEKQIAVAREAITLYESAKDTLGLAMVYNDIGDAYIKLNKLDSAIFFEKKSLEYFSRIPFGDRKFEGGVYTSIGRIYQQMGNPDPARENYEKAILVSERQNNPALSGNACLQLANLYQSLNKADSGFLYTKKALEAFTLVGKEKSKAIAYRMISDYYWDQKNEDSSFSYLRLATLLNDSLDNIEKKRLQEFQVAGFNQQLQLQEQEKERIENAGKLKTFSIIALIAVFSIIGLLLYRNNRQKQKANRTLQEKNSEIERALTELKATQKQLIQSEKMASLGELTAGIAHEIQNPLNFVNNFSEVSNELIDEMNEELNKGDIEEAKAISSDIKQNLEKINHHGKRAGEIVKGMLQHSRSGTGVKEPTNINALADEYLRIAYHGLRAKDKNFNAEIKTDFDNSIDKINIVPQDIGRVLLNLFNNAFYAVNEKQKACQAEPVEAGYQPTVSVTTKKSGNSVLITVSDNGNGIPQKIVDKIFQPFFTTKPTGQGTGLGLSLSYDIVKTHGGEIKVETREGEGSEFIIQLPIV